MTFEEKSIIVFGGSSGIGLATANLLSSRGSLVAVISNDAAGLARLPSQILALQADVLNSDEVARSVDLAIRAFGVLTGMVYSAGIQRYGSVVTTDEGDWDMVLSINLKGAYLAAKYSVPHIAKQGGAIVNVSSVQALACQNDVAAYTASKGGLNALTRAMALDHAKDGIRVNSVCPGSVDTPMLRASADLFGEGRSQDSVLKEWGGSHALGRIASANEVAEVIAFLLSDGASFMSGGEVKVDGGLTAALAVKTELR